MTGEEIFFVCLLIKNPHWLWVAYLHYESLPVNTLYEKKYTVVLSRRRAIRYRDVKCMVTAHEAGNVR
jgi:hypothetical protein